MLGILFTLAFLAGVAVGLGAGRIICEKVCRKGKRK